MYWLWWLLWVLVSGVILGVFFWTTRALIEQKKAWRAFARKRKLKVREHGFLQSLSLSGVIDDNELILASEERPAQDIRGRKFVTMFQFKLPVRMPAPGGVGSGEYLMFMRNMSSKFRLKLTYADWDENSIEVVTDDRDRMEPYFTLERMKVIDTLIKQKGVSVLFLFDEREAYLRLETIDPFLNQEQLDKLIDKLTPMLRVLHP